MLRLTWNIQTKTTWLPNEHDSKRLGRTYLLGLWRERGQFQQGHQACKWQIFKLQFLSLASRQEGHIFQPFSVQEAGIAFQKKITYTRTYTSA